MKLDKLITVFRNDCYGGVIFVNTTIPTNVIYRWRFILVVNEKTKPMLDFYITDNIDIPTELIGEFEVRDISNMHYSHCNNSAVVKVITRHVEALRQLVIEGEARRKQRIN